VADSYEHDNEYSSSIKGGKSLGQFIDYQIFNADSIELAETKFSEKYTVWRKGKMSCLDWNEDELRVSRQTSSRQNV
jgi:hypothetical protein